MDINHTNIPNGAGVNGPNGPNGNAGNAGNASANIHLNTFRKNLSHFQHWVYTHGKLPNTGSIKPGEAQLGRWFYNIRYKIKSQTLPRDYINSLGTWRSIFFAAKPSEELVNIMMRGIMPIMSEQPVSNGPEIHWQNDVDFKRTLKDYQKFTVSNRSMPKISSKDKYESNLAQWFRGIRLEYLNGRLSPSRVKILNNVSRLILHADNPAMLEEKILCEELNTRYGKIEDPNEDLSNMWMRHSTVAKLRERGIHTTKQLIAAIYSLWWATCNNGGDSVLWELCKDKAISNDISNRQVILQMMQRNTIGLPYTDNRTCNWVIPFIVAARDESMSGNEGLNAVLVAEQLMWGEEDLSSIAEDCYRAIYHLIRLDEKAAAAYILYSVNNASIFDICRILNDRDPQKIAAYVHLGKLEVRRKHIAEFNKKFANGYELKLLSEQNREITSQDRHKAEVGKRYFDGLQSLLRRMGELT